jgi:LPXTG-motif cell wall-anchored protein
VTAAQTALNAANASVAAASSAVTTATNDLATAQSAVDVAQAAVNALKNTIAAIQTTIDGLQKVLDAAVAALRNLLTGVQPLIDQLLGAIMAVLDGTPLVSFDSLSVVTEAIASSNTSGGQTAKVVGGELVGLEVLGTDVLSNVLGTSSVDLLDLVGGTLADVNGLIAELTGTLSSVLSTVPQFPTLSIPAPQVGLLQKSATTDIVNGFGVASTSVKGLSLTLPSVSIPTALALPGAAELPALDGITQVAGLLTSAPVKVDVATLSSNSRFAPAVVAAPGTGTPTTGTPTGAAPQLPRTGPTQALAVLGLVLMAGAVIARRRRTEDALV